MIPRKLAGLPATTTVDAGIIFFGGLDLVSPMRMMKTGAARDASNVESVWPTGYKRVSGYERFDGRAAPSDAQALTLTVSVTGTISVGNTITGATSGATGKVIYRDDSLVAYTRASGAFQIGETVNVAAVGQGTITDLSGDDGEKDYEVRIRYLAAEEYKASILGIPGSGITRGVFQLDGVWFGLRNNAGGTALEIYKSSGTGWTAVPMLYTVSFTTGTNDFVEGETITQGGNTATVKRVCLETGTWAGGTAAGRLIITQPTPGAFAAGAATGSGGGAATLAGASSAISLGVLSGDNVVEVDIETVSTERRVYAVDGTNSAWEFDGTVLAPIRPGFVPDHVMVHQGKLFLSQGSSVQYSETGTPWAWAVANGAGEFRAAGDVTGMLRLPGDQSTGAALIANADSTQILYGTGASSFQLKPFEDSSGAKSGSLQNMRDTLFLGDSGVTNLMTATSYGNFKAGTLTERVEPYLKTRRNSLTCTVVRRDRSQYRMFFSDGSALFLTLIAGKMIGAMPMVFPDVFYCAGRGKDDNGNEAIMVGSADGMVYQLDKGTSFDGDEISWDVTLPFSAQGGDRQVKRYRDATVEVQGTSYFEFSMQFDLAYGSDDRAQDAVGTSRSVQLKQARWDEFTWDDFVWDGQSLEPSYADIEGSGENIATRLFGASAMFDDITFNSMILSYSPRRRLR